MADINYAGNIKASNLKRQANTPSATKGDLWQSLNTTQFPLYTRDDVGFHSLPFRYGIIGYRQQVNFNTTTEQSISIYCSRYIIKDILFENPSVTLDTAVGGIWSGSGMTGTNLVASSQSYSSLIGAGTALYAVLTPVTATSVLTGTDIYFKLSTAQGVPATCNCWVIGVDLTIL